MKKIYEIPAAEIVDGQTVYTFSDGLVIKLSSDKKVTVDLTEEAYAKAEESIALKEELAAGAVVFNKYATTYGTLSMVRYANGTSFILNYNDYSVVCKLDGVQYTIPAYSFVTIKDNKVYNLNDSSNGDILVTIGEETKTVVAAGDPVGLN